MPSSQRTQTDGASENTSDPALLMSPAQVTLDLARQSRAAVGDAPLNGIEVLKVRTGSRPSAVAGAIAGVLRHHDHTEVQTIGAGATNQAVKAIVIARAYLHDDGIDVYVVPSFIDVVIDGQERTALRLRIQRWFR
jgi:stage V sporulation protein S